MLSFTLENTDNNARAGTLSTPHGKIKTPIFMPVGTRSAVKGATIDQVKEIGTQIMLVNNYHSYLRPGCDVVEHFGGLHNFMSTNIPILTDSGGFQVFSLGLGMENGSEKKLAKVTEEGVHFRSYLDGSKHFFTPENVMDMQCQLGADIIMAFDECAPGGSSHDYAKSAMDRTHRWAKRSKDEWLKNEKIRAEKGLYPQALFGIIQGVIYDDLRIESAKYISDLDTPGVAIGGLSVGESKTDMYRILDTLAPVLPENKPHYLMGVGTPEDIVEGIARGIDMLDCVLPTRIGRHGEVFTSFGNMKIGNEKYKYSREHIPMTAGYETSISKRYPLGYLRHLINVGEATGGLLLSLHNIEYLITLTQKAREAILTGTFTQFYEDFWKYPKKK
ncbi:tRNA guanosine(34) transglycosylase Tgt [Candidatus Gracilibacteria bacterium]|nr:MAG: tRNA guanosine(34) transglycosylase Tgt [Candidatus Gracilibacteria bacterium]